MARKEINKDDPCDNLLSFTQTPTPRLVEPPQLPRFRRLQGVTVIIMSLWVALGLITSHLLIKKSLNELLSELHSHGQTETEYLASAFEQEFNKAEQFAATIALQSNIISTIETLNHSLKNRAPLSKNDFATQLINEPASQETHKYLSRLSRALDINIMFILDKTGTCVISSLRARPCLGVNYQYRQYFQQAKEKGSGIQFTIGKKIAEPSFFFSNAIIKDNEFIGAVVVRYYSNELARLFSNTGGIPFLLDKQDKILASSNPELLMRQMDIQLKSTGNSPRPPYSRSRKNNGLQLNPFDSHYFTQPIWFYEDEPYLIFDSTLPGRDLKMVRLAQAGELFSGRQELWVVATLTIFIGLLLIFFVERNINYSSHRKAHLALLSQANKELSDTAKNLYEMAISDSLTGLKNHRYFMQTLEHHFTKCHKNNTPLTLIGLDIDHFKNINDTYGHPAGDEVIRHLAKMCLSLVRSDDVVGRLGGEEFAIILPNLELQKAMDIAERIRTWCEHNVIQVSGHTIRFTCSFGVAVLRPSSSIKAILNELDTALYQAKHKGRNCIVLAQA